MTYKPTTENFADDELDTACTHDVWSREHADELSETDTAKLEKPQRKQSALRSIEERRERERLRRELVDFDFESDLPIEID